MVERIFVAENFCRIVPYGFSMAMVRVESEKYEMLKQFCQKGEKKIARDYIIVCRWNIFSC